MLTFKTGDEARFEFTVLNEEIGEDVSVLGSPTVVMSQDGITTALEITSISGKTITCLLNPEDSVRFVHGLETWLQLSWNDGNGNVVVFPEHEVVVEEQSVPVEPIEDPEVEESIENSPDIEEPDDEYGESGTVEEGYDELDESDDDALGTSWSWEEDDDVYDGEE